MSANIFLKPSGQTLDEATNGEISFPPSLSSFLSKASLLSDRDIQMLIERKLLKVEPYSTHFLNPSSLDLCLGTTLAKYLPQTITLDQRNPEVCDIDISSSSYMLQPGEFILGTTREKVYIPDGYQGVIETKGNFARAGVQVHSNDGHIDPGFCGHITLEIVNLHKKDVAVELVPGIPICQLFIGKLSSPCNKLYKGKYLNQVNPTTYRP